MRCVFCRAYRSKPGHRLLSAGCTLLSTVRAQSALRAGAVAHGHYYSTRRARVCQGGFTNFSQKNGGEGGGSARPCLPLLFCPPSPKGKDIPPARARRALFPGGEGGESKFSYARGFAPCIPGIKPLAALTEPAKQVPGEGLPCLSPANPAFCFPFPPYPPSPLPRRGRGRFLVYFAGGFAPGTPAPEPKRHRNRVANHAPGESLPPTKWGRVANHAPLRGACLRRSGAG